ncbi:sarcoplasmic calcium-binding protein isoform X2 [Lycorma delicatula]|uniref:sarcoplasmic calcium-binding protein isoform X2 n=1 Tax=Lycorma delicatula TaxID=130591 RepID=UPI003F5195FA
MAFSLFRFSSRLLNSSANLLRNGIMINVTGDQGFTNLNQPRHFSSHASQPTSQKEKHSIESNSESDSDSDADQDKPKKGESEFWRRKMRTFHGILDINKDGVISYDDFKLLVDKFINLGHLSPRHGDEFQTLIKNMWEERWGSIDPYNLVTTELYLEEMHHVMNDKSLRKKVHHFLPYLFKAVDKNKDGMITIDEYKLFFECLNLPSEAAVMSFYVIDENNDGHLSMKEFVKLGREFFLSEDTRKPSKMFWGPLVD